MQCAGCVANGHMTVGRWGKEGRGSGRGEGEERGGGERRKGRGGGGEEREGRGGGPAGARWGLDRGPVEPIQHKARGLATGLKKKLKLGPAPPVDC